MRPAAAPAHRLHGGLQAHAPIDERRPRGNGAMIGLFTAAGLVGVAVQYLFGTFGLMVRAEMGFVEALLVNVPFIPGDIVKVVVAALIAAPVLRAFPDLRANTAATSAR